MPTSSSVMKPRSRISASEATAPASADEPGERPALTAANVHHLRSIVDSLLWFGVYAVIGSTEAPFGWPGVFSGAVRGSSMVGIAASAMNASAHQNVCP
jgi:hypothetical protein